jgi:hypothetical protein
MLDKLFGANKERETQNRLQLAQTVTDWYESPIFYWPGDQEHPAIIHDRIFNEDTNPQLRSEALGIMSARGLGFHIGHMDNTTLPVGIWSNLRTVSGVYVVKHEIGESLNTETILIFQDDEVLSNAWFSPKSSSIHPFPTPFYAGATPSAISDFSKLLPKPKDVLTKT